MDFVIEFVFEVILEGLFHYVKNNQKNRWLRFLTVFILLSIYLFVIAGLTYLTFISMQSNVVAGVLVGLILFAVILFGVKTYKKQLDIQGQTE